MTESEIPTYLTRRIGAADPACGFRDAKDEDAEHFYQKYDFVTLDASSWPRRLFLPIQVARAAFRDD